jgi:hypothetical protein
MPPLRSSVSFAVSEFIDLLVSLESFSGCLLTSAVGSVSFPLSFFALMQKRTKKDQGIPPRRDPGQRTGCTYLRVSKL